MDDHDLEHHGDRDVAPGLVDLAVNVAADGPPAWLLQVLTDSLTRLDRYPDPRATTASVAAAHGVDAAGALPTAGAAEAFTLIARARPWRRPVVVHPQFTEPEAAMRAAGHRPDRVLLRAVDGFVLDPAGVDPRSDLVMIGNPTNPTSVLHPRIMITALLRPGRVVVVDEAFLDAVPGEPETMISAAAPGSGLVVIRSLTKTWAIPGIRAGYVVGDPGVLADLSTHQPPWSVSTPALAAITAGVSERARREAYAYGERVGQNRTRLVQTLARVGLRVAGEPRGPYVLVDTAGWLADPRPDAVRRRLIEHGFAVRRGETFPGLGPSWIRMAVRDPETTAALGEALQTIRDEAVDDLRG